MAGPGSTASDAEPWDQALASATTTTTTQRGMRWQQQPQRPSASAYQKLHYNNNNEEQLLLDDGELPSLSKFAALPPTTTRSTPRKTTTTTAPAMVSPAVAASEQRRKFWAQMVTEEDGPDDELQDLRQRQQRRRHRGHVVRPQFSEDETVEYGSLDEGGAAVPPSFCGQTFTALEELCGGMMMTAHSNDDEDDTTTLIPKVRSTFDHSTMDQQQEHTAIEVEYLAPVRKKQPAVVSPPRPPSPVQPPPPPDEIPPIAPVPSEDNNSTSSTGGGQQQKGRGRLSERAKKAKHAIQQSRRLRSVDSSETRNNNKAPPAPADEQVAVEVEMQERSLPESQHIEQQQQQATEFPVTKQKNATLAAIAKQARENFQQRKGGSSIPSPREENDDEKKTPDDVYTSFTATEKRMFIKLINGGMPAVEATQQVRNRSHDDDDDSAADVVPQQVQHQRSTSPSEHVDTFPFRRSGQQYYDAVKRDQEEETFAAAAATTEEEALNAASKPADASSQPAAFVPKIFGKPRGFSELKNSPARKPKQDTAKGKVAAAAEEIEAKARANSIGPAKPDSTSSSIQNKAVGMRIAKKMTRYQKFDAAAPAEGRGLPYSAVVSPDKDTTGASVLPAPSGDQNETGRNEGEGSDGAMEEYFNAAGAERTTQAANDAASVFTMGTNATSYTQSTRTRRPGVAKSRLAVQRQLDTGSKRGWHDTIVAAAASTNRVWDPKVGWVDYEEPDIDVSGDVPDAAEPLRIDLSKVVQSSQKSETGSEDGAGPAPRGVPFPEEWQKERDEMIGETSAGTDAANSSNLTASENANQTPQSEPLLEDSSEDDHSIDAETTAKVQPTDIVSESINEGDKSLFSGANNASRERSMESVALHSLGSEDMNLSIETGPQPLMPPKRERSTRRSQAGQKPVPKLKMSKRDTSPMRLRTFPPQPKPVEEMKDTARSGSPPIENKKAATTASPTDVKEVSSSQDLDASEPQSTQATRELSDPIDSTEKQSKDAPQMEGNFTAAGWMTFLGKKVRAESEAASSAGVGDREKAKFNIQQERSAPDDDKPSTSLNISDLSPIDPGEDDYSEGGQTYGSSMYGPTPTELRSTSFMKRLTECAAPVMSSKRLGGLAPNAICGNPGMSEDDSYLESTISGSTRDFQPRASSVPKLRGVASSSVVSDDFGAKAAYLDAVAIKSMVSRSRRSSSSRRSGRPSGGSSIVSGMSGATDHSAKWSALLEKRRASGVSPLSSRQSSANVSRAAEKYASAKVGEIMEMARLSTRSKTVARSREVHREMNNAGDIDYSVEAAEDLAAARVEAMMAAASSSKVHEGEI